MTNKQRNQLQQSNQPRVEITAKFSGPLPPPETLARYDQVLPGAADRIITMAESQNHHRQALEAAQVNANIAAQKRGTNLGFVIAMTVIVGGVYLIAVGKSAVGFASIVTALASLAAIFVYGKRVQEKDLAQKAVDL